MTQQKDLPAQIKKVTDFRKSMAKFLKADESTVGQMSLNGILKALNSDMAMTNIEKTPENIVPASAGIFLFRS
jgi:hypothetical protein